VPWNSACHQCWSRGGKWWREVVCSERPHFAGFPRGRGCIPSTSRLSALPSHCLGLSGGMVANRYNSLLEYRGGRHDSPLLDNCWHSRNHDFIRDACRCCQSLHANPQIQSANLRIEFDHSLRSRVIARFGGKKTVEVLPATRRTPWLRRPQRASLP
jgi:hypothetical protein